MKKKVPFSVRIFMGLFLGIAVGALLTPFPNIAVLCIQPIGDIFLNLIRFIVVPIVFLTVLSGIASMQDLKSVGKIGLKTLAFYFATTAIAVAVGLAFSHLFRPFFAVVQTESLEWRGTVSKDFWEPILNIFPSNLFAAFVSGDMLQVIVAAVLFGIALLRLPHKNGLQGVQTLEKIAVQVMDMILKLSPIGVFALIAPVIAQSGYKVLGNLLTVVVCMYLAFALHILLVYLPIVYARRQLTPKAFLKGMLPVVLLAFSTASSISAMSENLEHTKKLGADASAADFIIPLGATLNMDGTGIYQGVCVTFIAACFGMQLTFAQCVAVTLSATLASIGTAGVPGAGMIMLAVALESAGLPIEGVALVAGLDRIFDMGRTAVNVLGDSTCALFVSKKAK